jgi:hypothetical protein
MGREPRFCTPGYLAALRLEWNEAGYEIEKPLTLLRWSCVVARAASDRSRFVLHNLTSLSTIRVRAVLAARRDKDPHWGVV